MNNLAQLLIHRVIVQIIFLIELLFDGYGRMTNMPCACLEFKTTLPPWHGSDGRCGA